MKKQTLCNQVKEYLSRYPRDKHGLEVLNFLNNHDKFWQRENEYGHITASTWVVNQARDSVLLTHHKKLNYNALQNYIFLFFAKHFLSQRLRQQL